MNSIERSGAGSVESSRSSREQPKSNGKSQPGQKSAHPDRCEADSAGQPKAGGFALKPGKSFQKEVGRIVRRQLDKALRDLCRLGATADEAIHNVRKRFKRVRAVLRLVREELGDRVYRQENESLRDAAAAFSEVRNARVLVDAVEKLRHRESDVSPGAFDALERFLKAKQCYIHDRLARNVEAMDTLREAIENGRSRASQWPLPRDGRRAVRRGLRRSCKAGVKALDDALQVTTAEHFHECRKQAKSLYHQVQMLERVAPASVRQLSEHLHELEEKLGDEHDLGMLRVEVVACIAGGLPEVTDRLVALIDEWRHELQHDCLAKAQQIYRDDAAAIGHSFRDCAKQLSAKKH